MAGSFPFEIDLASLEFNDSMKSGDPVIDAEHANLYARARGLVEAAATGKPSREIETLLDQLVHDLATHFAHEDNIMEQSGWDEAEQHSGIHRLLMMEANRLLERHKASQVGFLDIYRFVVGTLVRDHLTLHDVEFHHFLQEQKDA